MSFDFYIYFILKILVVMPDMVAHTINTNIWEAEIAR